MVKKIAKFWEAPSEICAEIFKAPRFKLLAKRKSKTKKEPNQKAKDEYKYYRK